MSLKKYLNQRRKQLGKSRLRILYQLNGPGLKENTKLTKRLYRRRLELGLNYQKLSGKTHLPQDLFMALEKGKIIPDQKTLKQIAYSYQLPESELMKDIQDTFLENIASVYQISKDKLAKNYGEEINKTLKKQYGIGKEIKRHKKNSVYSKRTSLIISGVLIALCIIACFALFTFFGANISTILISFIILVVSLRHFNKTKEKYKS